MGASKLGPGAPLAVDNALGRMNRPADPGFHPDSRVRGHLKCAGTVHDGKTCPYCVIGGAS